MIAAYGRHTERAVAAHLAKQKALPPIEPEVRTVNIIERRKRQDEELEQSIKQAQVLNAERIERDRRIANEAIARANRRLRELQTANCADLGTIMRRICKALKVSRVDIMSARRNAPVAFARQAIYYWACRRTTLSLPEIGRKVGGFDHTTVLHGKRAYPIKRAAQGRYLREVR